MLRPHPHLHVNENLWTAKNPCYPLFPLYWGYGIMDIYNVGDQGRKAIEGTNNNFKLSSYFCLFYGGKSQNISSTRESCNIIIKGES